MSQFQVGFIIFLSVFLVLNAVQLKSIDYDEIPTSFNNYKSVIEPLDESLKPIYEFANDFIDATISVNFSIGLPGENAEWQDIFDEYSGVVSFVVIMLVIGFIIPIVGIIFAISRCCNCCGAKATQRHPKQGKTTVVIVGGFSIVLSAFLLFAIVVGMRGNVVLEKGAEKVFDKVIVTMQDTIKYSANTYSQIEFLMQRNYNQFSAGLTSDLNEINAELSSQIDSTDLVAVKDGFVMLKESISSLKNTNEITITIKQEEINIKALKEATFDLSTLCESNRNEPVKKKCAEIKAAVTSWIVPEFTFPDVKPIITQMERIPFDALNTTITSMISFGSNLNPLLTSVADAATINTAKAGEKIAEHLQESKAQLETVKEWMTARIEDIQDARGYYNEWGKLRYGLTFVLPTVLVVLVVLLFLGLLIGSCCRTVAYKENGCGNASVASDLFMTNVALIFIFALVFAVVICGYFTVGLLGQRYMCNTFDTMDNVKGLRYLDDLLDVEAFFGDGVTFQHLIKSCNDNKSLYEVMMLKNVFDLEQIINYLEDFKIREELIRLTEIINEKIEDFNNGFSTAFISDLKQLQLDNVNVNLYDDQLSQMQSLAYLLVELQNLDPTINNLDAIIKKYRNFIVIFEDLTLNYNNFHLKIKMSGSDTYQKRLDEFKTFLDTYHLSITDGNFREWGRDLTETSINTVQTYLNRIRDKMLDTVGLCAPASVAIKATLNEMCGNVFNPMNSFWLANFFALIAFIPLLPVFIYLISYHRRYIKTENDQNRPQNYYTYNPPGARGSTIDAYDVRAHHPPPTPPHTAHTTPNHPHNANNNMSHFQHPVHSTPLAVQERNMRRQVEYPYAMKGTSLADSVVALNRKDNYTKF